MMQTKIVPWIFVQRSYSSQLPQSTAVIKLPVYVQKHMQKLKKKEEKWALDVKRKIFYRGNTAIPVISSNKKEYNFYLGQIYNDRYPVPLMSRYWMKPKSAGQKFTINPWDANPSLPVKVEQTPVLTELDPSESMSHFITEFHHMKLSDKVLDGIQAVGFQYPTPIQTITIPKILRHQHVVCVAETGSGKTMSYAIPIINNLLHSRDKLERFSNAPLALIIAPGRELAEQIAVEANKLGQACGVNVKAMIPEGTKYRHLKPRHFEPIDILVATLGIIYRLNSQHVFELTHLQHLVLDEADTILDDSFIDDFQRLMKRVMVQHPVENEESKPSGAQLISVSATLPKNIDDIMGDMLFDGTYEKAMSPYIHRVLPHIPQKFIRVNGENRPGILLELVKSNFKKKVPVMIFSNNSATCDWMSCFFKENDVRHVRFHAGLTFQERSDAFENFQSGDVDVFCCTDLASRGLDTQRVRHVINYDFPNSVSDYILRVGRAGRVGTNHGYVTNLVLSKSGVHVVQDIETAVRKSIQYQDVDANIKRKINQLYRIV